MRAVLARYAVAWGYLAVFSLTEIVYALLPARDQAATLAWASTNVHNLTHDPVGCMVASAFLPAGALTVWPILISLALFGANGVLGNWRTAVTCGVAHAIGTLVSEGILWYQISHDAMPGADRLITDVGPSYVVVSAIGVGLIWGGRLTRCAATIDLVVLIFIGRSFAGISHLQLAAVGHATALFTGCTLGSFLAWQRRRLAAGTASPDPRAAARAGGEVGPPEQQRYPEHRDLESQENQ